MRTSLPRLACLAALFFRIAVDLQSASHAPAEDLANRIGFYQWRGVSDSTQQDLLTFAREKSVETGSRVFRFYLGARFDYVHTVLSPLRFEGDGIEGAVTLQKIMNLPRYRAVLEDPALKTIVLTAYPVADYGGGPDDLNLTRPWGLGLEALEREQVTALAEWLFQEFGNTEKTVIISNHEADEKLVDIANYTGSSDAAIETLRQWTRTRFAAIDAVRKAHAGSKLKLFHAFEIALVNMRIVPYRGGYRKATPSSPAQQGWNALRDVVPHVPFDLISYSSYESTNSPYETQNTDRAPAETGTRLARDLDRIRDIAQPSLSDAGRKTFGKNFIMLGELGYARDRFEQLPSGGILPRLYSALRTATEWGCPYVVLWQVTDHPRSGGDAWGFGMYDRQGKNPALNAPGTGCRSLKECLRLLFREGFDGWSRANGY